MSTCGQDRFTGWTATEDNSPEPEESLVPLVLRSALFVTWVKKSASRKNAFSPRLLCALPFRESPAFSSPIPAANLHHTNKLKPPQTEKICRFCQLIHRRHGILPA